MSLANYAALKTSIKRWAHRDDIDDIVDDIILLAEGSMYANVECPLRVREMMTSGTTSTSGQTLALPTNFLEFRKLTLSSGNIEFDCQYVTPESMNKTGAAGVPRYFTVTSTIEFDKNPDTTYTVNWVYFAYPTGLSSSNTTNTILTNYPQIYLLMCQWATHVYTHEEEKAAGYWTMAMSAIKGATKRYKKSHGPAPTMRVEGLTP